MAVKNHTVGTGMNSTYTTTKHSCCDPMSGASKGGEYQENATMGSMTKPPHRPSKLSSSGVGVDGPYGGKKPQSR